MDLATYQRLAMRTKPHPDPRCDYLELARIGMVGELGEIAELLKKEKYHSKPLDPQDLLKETGDLLWYLALYGDVTGYAFETGRVGELPTAHAHLFELLRLVSAMVNEERPLRSALSSAIGHLALILGAYGFTLPDAAALNIEKLRRRYPDGFTIEQARGHDGQ